VGSGYHRKEEKAKCFAKVKFHLITNPGDTLENFCPCFTHYGTGTQRLEHGEINIVVY
jgi:hypothetical protein